MPRLPRMKRRYVVAAAALTVIGLFLWLLPVGLRLGAEHWLREQGFSVTIDNIDLNLFTARMSIDDLRFSDDGGDGLRLTHAAVTWHYGPLFDRHLHLAGITLRDARLDIRRGDTLSVAGFEIATDGGKTPANTPEEPAPPWGFGLDTADVDGFTVRYHEPTFSREVTLATSTAADVATWRPDTPIPLDADLKMGDASIVLGGRLQPFGERIRGQLKLRVDSLGLDAVAPFVEGRAGVAELAGVVGTDLEIDLDYTPDTGLELGLAGNASLDAGRLDLPDTVTLSSGLDWEGDLDARLLHPEAAMRVDSRGQLRVRDTSVRLPKPAYDISLTALTWQGRTGLLPDDTDLPEQAEPPIRASGTLTGNSLRVIDRRVGRRLAEIAGLETGEIELRGPSALTVERIALSGVEALARPADAPGNEDYPHIVALAGLTAEGVEFAAGDRLDVARVAIDAPRAYVRRDAEGGTEFSPWLPPAGDDAEADAGEPLRVRIDEIVTGGEGRLRIEDHGVQPIAVFEFTDPAIDFRNLDTGAPDQASPYTLRTGVGRYGRIELEGEVRPLADPLSLTIAGSARALNLNPASGYIRQALERRIDRGTLNADLDVEVDAGKIDGKADLTLQKFRLGNVVGESGAVERQLGLPLDRALSLLRDENGNIEVSLPLGGDLENPQFSINSIVRQAVFEGIQVAILSYYSPLGVLKVADTLVDLATALRFEPVEFEAGAATLDDDARDYLTQMAQLLDKRPQAQLVICGQAVPADRRALAPPPAQGDDQTQGESKTETDDALRDRLLALAQERTVAVTQFLVDSGIDSNRLVLCNPAVSDDEAAPRTTISL